MSARTQLISGYQDSCNLVTFDVQLQRRLNNDEHCAITDATERHDRFLKRRSRLCFAQSP
jgi:hypothetical protein